MIHASAWLLGQTTTRTTFDFARLQSYTERWHYLVLALVCMAIFAVVALIYRRDSVELRPGRGMLLMFFRLFALLGLLAYYLGLEKRTEQRIEQNSRVLLLVDTSQSMGLKDRDTASAAGSPTRLEQVAELLGRSPFISELRAKHDVIAVRFDSETSRLVSLAKLSQRSTQSAAGQTQPSAGVQPTQTGEETIDWNKLLVPQGGETRLGQALRQLINDERSSPLSGIVVLTDGQQNAGVDPTSAIDAARQLKIPIYAVGLGSDRRPANVRISDFVAPARAYPGDSFNVTGYIQSQQLGNRTVTVELTSRPAGAADAASEGKLESTDRVLLPHDGERVPVKFEITPNEKGRRTYRLAVKAPPEDNNPADDKQEADVEVVDRKTKVLLVASGPTREYIFLRNQLRRDKDVIVDVWLQSAPEGISQDANKILDGFPKTPQELYEYDAIAAFDPNWLVLDENQVDMLERWVAERAGGLIAVAGPVETDRWVQEPKMAKIRALYPVEFNRRLALLEDGRFGSDTPWPVNFTREGIEAEFLWLADSGSRSQQIWSEFPGVYGYYAVRGAKSGATVFARYSDPQAGSGDRQPVYLAGQFYGSGRVFYLGSGEMWRLRELDDSYFEQFYTKLVRHVSQGRLLLGSSRGMLLVDRDRYPLGSTVVVRAQLSDAQFEPLSVPRVPLQLVGPTGSITTLQLAADGSRKGTFAGQFTALKEGAYRLELAVPGSDEEPLSRRIQVRVPDLELESPQRNDALLVELTKKTGGLYYVGTDSVLGGKGVAALPSVLEDRKKVTYLGGVTDKEFADQWMKGLLFFIAGALSLEWLLRRLMKLA